MVLVDPSIPDEAAVRERVAPKFAALGDGAPRAAAERLRHCADQLRSATLNPGMPEFNDCTAQPMPEQFSVLSERLGRLNADPARLLTQASAIASGPPSGREVINPQRSFGDMPLIVLTSGQRPMPPDMAADVREQATEYFRALASAHEAYAGLSTRGHHQLVQNSGHFIQFDDPAAVLAAINQVLKEIPPGH
jgi:pimeloyl-ACP methyl ester carboxylesterase